MQLIIITPSPINSGIGKYGNLLAAYLNQSGRFTKITILTERAHKETKSEFSPELNIEYIWKHDDIFAGLKVLARLRTLKPDVIWYNMALTGFSRFPIINLVNLLSLALFRFYKYPSVITMHEMVDNADLRTLKLPHNAIAKTTAKLLTFFSLSSDIICVTLRCNVEILNKHNIKAQVLYIPIGAFEQPELLPEIERNVILVCTMIAPHKGIDGLISAFQELRSTYPALQLKVAGAEHPRFPGYLTGLQKKYKTVPSIIWTGYIPDNKLKKLFEGATIVVLANEASTGPSSTLYRAATWGRPVVASDLVELKATAEEEGLIANYFPRGDYLGLAKKLSNLLSNELLRRKQAEHNYKICLNHLTPEHTCNSYIQAFDLAVQCHHKNYPLPDI